MNTVTIDDVMAWNPCEQYNRTRITRLFRGREQLGVLDILALRIPADDRFWAVLHEELIPAPVLHEFGCQFAERALDRVERDGGVVDPCSRAAIETKRRWLRGEASDEELYTAWDGARNAAREPAWNAAWSAAWSAAWFAARDAERRAQLAIVRRWATRQPAGEEEERPHKRKAFCIDVEGSDDAV